MQLSDTKGGWVFRFPNPPTDTHLTEDVPRQKTQGHIASVLNQNTGGKKIHSESNRAAFSSALGDSLHRGKDKVDDPGYQGLVTF